MTGRKSDNEQHIHASTHAGKQTPRTALSMTSEPICSNVLCVCVCSRGCVEFQALIPARSALFLVNVNDMYIGASLLLYGEWSHHEVKGLVFDT